MVLQSINFLFFIVVVCSGSVDIEKYFKTCNRNLPDLNDCLVDAVQNGIAAMAEGIKDIGVPAVDPYRQKEQKFEYKNNLIQVKMVSKNIIVIGLKGSTVRDARLNVDDDSFHLEVDMFSPAISVSGEYEGRGSYNAPNIIAKGSFVINMTDLVYTWKLDGKAETINNEVYMKIKSFYMGPDVSSMQVYLTNDAAETKDLTALGMKLVNENWRLVYKELLPIVQTHWDEIGVKVANKIFLKVPFDRLFPNKS